MLYPYQVTFDESATFQLVNSLPSIEAETPIQAVHKLARAGRLPKDSPIFWVRIVTSVHDNGMPHKVISIPVGAKFIPDAPLVYGRPKITSRFDLSRPLSEQARSNLAFGRDHERPAILAGQQRIGL